MVIGLGVFGLTLALERLSPRIPGALIALLSASLLTAVLKLDRQGVTVLGGFAGGLPAIGLPALSFDRILPLASLAIVTALVVMVQTAATSRAFPPDGADPNVNRDYIGMGAASVMAGLAGAFPVDASPPQTAVAFQAGATSQLCGLTAAALISALALFGGGLLGMTPTAALGGVLLFVAQRIFNFKMFAALLGPTRAEFGLAVLTALLIFFLPIQTGVAFGVFLSLVHGVFTITRTQLIPFEHIPGGTIWWPATPSHPGETQPGVMVMGFQAPLSFLNAYEFRRGVLNALSDAPKGARLFVLEAGSMVEIDFTASELLIEAIKTVRAQGVDFAVARLESVRAQAAFDRFGVTEQLGEDHIFQSVDAAIRTLANPQTD
jgi:MFS superfamily sulfate permease-like transporter